jgi:catechol 2,3-dioxygenase-like lactoylglutathione lyase family enzyme
MITLEHVAITSTKDTFAPTLAFYQNVLGMKVIREGKDLVFISDGQGGRIELLMYGEPMLPTPNHLAFVVPFAEFDPMVEVLNKSGVKVDAPMLAASGDRLCYFNDPAGNRAQIVGRHNPMPQ